MNHTDTANNAQAPADALGVLESAVIAGERYYFRLPATDREDRAGSRALVGTVLFLDASGNEVSGSYKGCLTSEKFGQFVYLATTADVGTPPWSEQQVQAPDAATSVRVMAYPRRVSPQLHVFGELQMIEAGKAALFEQEFDVRGGFLHRLHLALADSCHSDRAAVLQVTYLDADGKKVPGPYEGCNQSERFGEFTYAATPKGDADEVRLALRVPGSAVRARLVGHRWKGTSALKLDRELRLEAEVPDGLEAIEEWLLVGLAARTLPILIEGESAGRIALLRGQYVAQQPDANAPAMRIVSEFMDTEGRPIVGFFDDAPGVVGEPMHVLGNAGEVRPFTCFTWCPPGSTSARLRIYPGEGAVNVAMHREVSLTPIGHLDGAQLLDDRLGAASRIELQRPVFNEWRLRIAFEGLRTLDPINRDLELCISFGSAGKRMALSGIDTKLHAGNLRRTGDSLYLKPGVGPSGTVGVERLRGAIQILPPPGAESVMVHLSNDRGSEIPYSCVVEPCDALVEARLGPGSGANASRVEMDCPDAARVMMERLLEQYPEDPAVLGSAVDVYRRLGEASVLEAVASRALSLPGAGGKLRHKARHVLASLQEQDPHWSIQVPGIWQGQNRRSTNDRPLRVAHLFKTSIPYENSGGAIRCMNIVKFQKQIGMDPLVVTPLAYPEMNITGEPWEREEIEGVPHFRLNGVSRDDLRTIPSTRQLEYSALLTANLLRERGVDLVQASSGYRGYEQALVGLAVARKLEVPFVYEVRSYHEHTWRPMADWLLDAEFTKRRMAQEDRCMSEADAVVTICETMKSGLIKRGIDPDKIFVVPNSIDPEAFKPAPIDPSFKTSLGLREPITVGYVSNVSAREGHQVLLRAVARARAESAAIDCLIVGSGPQLESLKSLAEELGIAEHVVFTGEIPHDDVASYYGAIDIFVVPRIADFASDFVTPMKPFEAMAMKRPVVISDRPALKEVVEPGVRGAVFEAGNHAMLSKILISLSKDAALRSRYAEQGCEWVMSERTWGRTILEYEKVYAAAFKRHSPEMRL